MTNTKISFSLFVVEWSIIENWSYDVPSFHIMIAEALADFENWKRNTLVIQAARNSAKSTLVDLWICWMLTNDPTLRFQIWSADDKSARRTVADCRMIITKHPRCNGLYDSQQWTATRFTVAGALGGRNSSVDAYGITSNKTSSRADIIICDDIENPKNVRDADGRRRVSTSLKEIPYILTPRTGRKLYIGTPHTSGSIYPAHVSVGCSSLFLPGMTNTKGEFPNMTGDSLWPERFTEDYIWSLQNEIQYDDDGKAARPTEGHFLSQFLLRSVPSGRTAFDPTRLQIYDSEVEFVRSKENLSLNIKFDNEVREMVSVACFFDPSRSDRGDDSVLAIVFTDEKGRLYIHRTIEITGDMDEQVIQVVELLKEFRIPLFSVETNGCGAFFPQRFIRELEGSGIGVDEYWSSENKNREIIEAYNQPLLGRLLYVSRQVNDSKFPNQLADFDPGSRKNSDDFIDAPAKAILLDEPYRLGIGNESKMVELDTSWINTRNTQNVIEIERFKRGKRYG